MQDAPIGTLLVTLSATDPDYQLNALVAYTFENNSGISGPFELDRETGQLWTQKTLDREQTALYSVRIYVYRYSTFSIQVNDFFVFCPQLTVVATDQFGAGRATPTTITVTVLDINDHDPYLLRTVCCITTINQSINQYNYYSHCGFYALLASHILQHWNFAISEDQHPFLPFDYVQGADDDIGTNAILYYHLIDSGRLIMLQTTEIYTPCTDNKQ